MLRLCSKVQCMRRDVLQQETVVAATVAWHCFSGPSPIAASLRWQHLRAQQPRLCDLTVFAAVWFAPQAVAPPGFPARFSTRACCTLQRWELGGVVNEGLGLGWVEGRWSARALQGMHGMGGRGSGRMHELWPTARARHRMTLRQPHMCAVGQGM